MNNVSQRRATQRRPSIKSPCCDAAIPRVLTQVRLSSGSGRSRKRRLASAAAKCSCTAKRQNVLCRAKSCVQGAPAVTERVKHVVAGAVQRQAVAGAKNAPHRRSALEVNHLLDVQLHLPCQPSAQINHDLQACWDLDRHSSGRTNASKLYNASTGA